MNIKSLLFVCANLLIAGNLIAQEDIIVIEGGADKGGLLEATINGDTTATGDRVNPNRIYELEAGSFYLQHGPIIVDNPSGTITIRGQQGGPKPVILKQPVAEVAIGQNDINSSFTLLNVQYHNMETSNTLPWVAFAINGDNHRVDVEDCLIENSQGIVFNAGNVTKGAVIILRNNYFRDLNDFSQWWGARAAECKYAIDSLVIENNTFSGGGLTFLSQESVTDVAIINHNTFINNHKYPFLNQYWRELYFTNNLFVNANMVGEDMENVATGGQDPDALMHGIFGVDTIESGLNIQPKYLDVDSNLTAEVDEISDYIIYAADNVVTYSPTLDNYYNGTIDKDVEGVTWDDAPASFLTWGGEITPKPYRVVNVPGIWQNSRSEALDEAYDNIKEENNSVYAMSLEDLGLATDPLPQEAADLFIEWNRSQWGVPGVVAPTDFTAYYFGDHNPQTVPGVETETSTAGGITKISDMIEDFSYTADLTSQSDGLRIGALHWNDEEFDPAASLAAIKAAYGGEPGTPAEFPIDFETETDAVWEIFSNGTAGPADFLVVDNPDKSGINTSDKVLKFIVNPDADPWAGTYSDSYPTIEFTEANHTISMMVWKLGSEPVGIKVESPTNGGPVTEVKIPVTQPGQWEQVTADFSALIGYGYDRLTLFPDFPETRTSGDTVYLDNIALAEVTGTVDVKSGSLFVYPNPANDILNVNGGKNADIIIMNIDGRVVKSVKNVSSVNVSDLADGLYTISIKEGNRVSKQKVLISKY